MDAAGQEAFSDMGPPVLDVTENACAKRMSQQHASRPPSNENVTPRLVERVRDFAVGRRTTSSAQTRVDRDAVNASNDTAFAHLTSVSARHDECERAVKEKCLQGMDRQRPLRDRIVAIKAACLELQHYSVATLTAIWAVIADMTSADASTEARQSSLELLIASASHPNLGSSERETLFNMITTPISPSHSRSQVLALKALTHDGYDVTPFRRRLSAYLVESIKHMFEATLDARSASKKNRQRRPIIEEVVFEELLGLVKNVLESDPTNIEEDDLSRLVGSLIFIANKTTVQKDLDEVAIIFRKITESHAIPSGLLEPSLETLCGIACTTDPIVGEATWGAIKNLLGSTYRVKVVDIILSILQSPSKERQTMTMRGAMLLVKHIVEADVEDDLPDIDLQRVVDVLQTAASKSSRLQLDCLQFLVSCLEDQDLTTRLLDCNWSNLDTVIYRADRSNKSTHDLRSMFSGLSERSPLIYFIKYHHAGIQSGSSDLRKALERLAYILESRWAGLDVSQRALALSLSLYVGCHIDPTMLDTAVDRMVEERLLFPPAENWVSHLRILLEVIAFDTSKSSTRRHRVLALISEGYHVDREQMAISSEMKSIATTALTRMAKESDISLTNILIEFLAEYALHAEDEIFEAVLVFIVGAAHLEDTSERSMRSHTALNTENNRAATYLVWLFQQCLLQPFASRTESCFHALVSAASDSKVPTDSRLTMMKLLARLRCNSDCALKVVPVPDSLGLAAALCRTESSAAGTYSRVSVVTESPGRRTGRTSGIEMSRSARSRSTTRSGSGQDRSNKATPPLWMYPGSRGLPIDPSEAHSEHVFIGEAGDLDKELRSSTLEIEQWLELMLDILRRGSDWEIYSYILVHLPSQLTNVALFADRTAFVRSLHDIILTQLRMGSFHEPPASTGVKKGDVALCLYNTMILLLPYQKLLSREQLDDTVRVFYTGIGMWDRAAKCCIHALTLCSHEIPSNLRRSLLVIIQKMSQIITQSHLAVDTLEFLAGLVRQPEAYQIAGPESQDFLRTIFGICISYIHHAREQREKFAAASKSTHTSIRHSGLSSKSSAASEPSQAADIQRDLPVYVFTLAYQVVTFWFLAIDLRERSKHVGWIVKNLTWKDDSGLESMEEQSQVTLDMIHRTVYNDLGETQAMTNFCNNNGPITKETWLYGMSIISLETVEATGLTQITKRQASGTTHAMYQQHTAPLPPHHITTSSIGTNSSSDATMKVFPQHVLLQLGFTIAPVPIPLQPILLPDDESVRRAISSFDRNDTVDGHKAGVVYIAPEQTSEASILANTCGSKVYEDFLSGLGTKVCLKNAGFNTQGLDRASDLDGTHTYAWRDRVTEIVYHVTTMMPTLPHEPQCNNKKRHIGNDYVKIIFNESGLPFKFETFASQFNHVNIVITPETISNCHSILSKTGSSLDTSELPTGADSRGTTFFIVQTFCSSSFPHISPTATPKVVTASALPSFVRQLALSASVLSLVWSNREGGENVSSWRNRLKEILKLRQRYANTGTSANVSYPMGNPSDRGGAPSYVDGDLWTGKLAMAGMTEKEQFLYSADFTRWN